MTLTAAPDTRPAPVEPTTPATQQLKRGQTLYLGRPLRRPPSPGPSWKWCPACEEWEPLLSRERIADWLEGLGL